MNVMKKKWFLLVSVLTASVLWLPSALAQKEEFQEGLHYFTIEGAPAVSEGPVELIEAFSYLCTHCNSFEPYIQSWLKRKPENVGFRRVPVVFGRSTWEMYARAYVTAELMGIGDDAHRAMMDKLWKQKQIMRSLDELAAFYAEFGADPDRFMSTSKSFAVDGKIRKDQLLMQTYGIRGTPALVVNGKYRIQAGGAVSNFDVMLNIADFLIAREQAARTAAVAPATSVAASASE